MTYLERMNSGKSTYTGGIPAAAKMQDPAAAAAPMPNVKFSLADFASRVQGGMSEDVPGLFDRFSSAKLRSSGSGVAAAAESPGVDYLNADLAKHYGMSAQTAYAEAMSNTAYQRAVKDMQAAGLNPALLAQSSYAQPAGSGYVSGSAGSGRSYGTSAKSASQSDKSGLWQGLASLAVAAGVFLSTKSKAGASAAAVAAKSLATVAGQSAKALAKR